MAWGDDGSLFVGETRRGWGSAGDADQGLERLTWTNEIPFEMKAVRAMPDGFEIEFTKPADIETAKDLASYYVESYIYKYHPVYGSPPVNTEKCTIKGVKVSDDGLKARIVVDNLRSAYIHTITLSGIRDQENKHPLLHPIAYYTLNNIPQGAKLSLTELSTENSALKSAPVVAAEKNSKSTGKAKPAASQAAPKQVNSKTPGFFDVKGLLVNYTCSACHTTNTRQIGPAFVEIAKRNYTNQKIVELIHNPQPQNWPDYETAMPPMPQVTNEDALKIAAWINSLDD